MTRRAPDRHAYGGGRPAPPRARRRGVPVATVAVVALAALIMGVAVGYLARGGPGPARLVTERRAVPIMTVTVERPAEGAVTRP